MCVTIRENTPKLETPRLVLRQFTEADVPAFLTLMRDEEVNRFLPWFPLETEADARAFLQTHYFSYYEKASAYQYAICLKDDNIPIGYVGLQDGPAHDFGYALRQRFWQQGIVTEASKAVLNRVQRAGYPYVTATHDVRNTGSGKVMQKLGLTYRYSYVEQWQPKNIRVTFRLYQLNFAANDTQTYMGYWDKYPEHFVEKMDND